MRTERPSSGSICSTRGARRRFYSDRERAALEWTEAVTRVADGHVPEDAYARSAMHFTEDELVALTLAVVAINSWNRLCISFRMEAGQYRPGMFKHLKTA